MKIIILTIFLLLGAFNFAAAEWRIDLESGSVFSGYNDVQIPKETGTRFSLVDDLTTESDIFYRIRASYTIDDRHYIGLLVAPLTLNADGVADKDILYEGTRFPDGSALSAKYTFNSYRLTYRYRVKTTDRFRADLGFTAKIRDAGILVESDSLKAEKTNVGFVPLLSFRIELDLSERIGVLLDGDALAAPQGRAEDVLLALRYNLSGNLSANAGYRILEGGADVDEVYNFALLHYLVFGVSMKF